MARREFFICCIVILLVKGNHFSEDRLVREVLSTLCPYSTFCNINATKQLARSYGKDDLCCLPCSCSHDCWETANCCIDKDDVVDKPPILKCKESLVNRDPWDTYKYSGLEGGVRRYRIVDFCPETQKNSSLDIKCKSMHATALEDVVWVSDRESGKIYQNKHCAECHGVQDFVHWDIKTQCYEILQRNDIPSLFEQLSDEYCNIINVPPDSVRLIVDRYICFLPHFDKCNMTGTWTNFNSSILSACHKYNSPVLTPRLTGSFTTYKNAFCYLCNKYEMDRDFTDLCPRHFDNIKVRIEMSGIINFDVYKKFVFYEEHDGHPTARCEIDEVFDVYMERCRPLICPFGSAPFYGVCEPIYKSTYGLGIDVAYQLKEVGVSNSSIVFGQENDWISLGQKIFRKFLTESGLRKLKCPFCDLLLYMVKNIPQQGWINGRLYLYGQFYTSTSCQLDDFVHLLGKFDGRKLKLPLADTDYLVLQTEIETREFAEFAELAHVVHNTRNALVCGGELRFKSQPFCAQVEMNYAEVLALKDAKKKMLLDALFERQLPSSVTLRLCLDEYYSFMSQKAAAVANAENALKYLFLFISLIFLGL